jgi:4-hydroxy-2-oxoheptanedioate aldolase
MARVNRLIDLFEQDQPTFGIGVPSLTHAAGLAAAGTPYDYFIIDFEHHPFDMVGLRAFTRGLVDGGPTRSGHRAPAVVATLPTTGVTAAMVEANAWQIAHLLAAGVHGIILCHAETPEAVRTYVANARYAINTPGADEETIGRRGGGGQTYAADIWGLPVPEYLAKADPWPLNPRGELLLALKIENKRGLANCEAITAVPGVGMAEWGPGDMGMSLAERYFLSDYEPDPDFAHDPPFGPAMEDSRRRVGDACRAAGVVFYCTMRAGDWRQLYEMGVRSSSVTPRTDEFIDDLRRLAGRTLPW